MVGTRSAGGGRGTESMMVQALWKACSRKEVASSVEVGTEEKGVGLREASAAWRFAIVVGTGLSGLSQCRGLLEGIDGGLVGV